MARYYLDTNICIYGWQRKDPRVVARLLQVPDRDELVISTLVAAELASGVMKSENVARNRAALEQTLAFHTVEPWAADAIWHYGHQSARLRRAGTPIGAIDLLLGCQALADPEGILVTHNVREFQRIEGLRIEDWASP